MGERRRRSLPLAHAPLQDRVGLQADRVLVSLRFQELMEVRNGEGGVAGKSAASPHRHGIS